MKLPFSKELERFEVKGRIIVVAFAILFGALIYYFDGVWTFICKIFSLASPFFIGFAIAFNVPFSVLASTFDYPDVLRRPATRCWMSGWKSATSEPPGSRSPK